MRTFWTQARIAGLLLVLGFIVPIAALVVVIASGADFGRLINPGEQGFAEIRAHVGAFSLINLLGAVGSLLVLSGLAMLSGLLREAGDHTLSMLGLALFTVSTVLFVSELAFLMRVPAWIAEEMADTPSAPDFYLALRVWMSGLQNMTIIAGMMSFVGYGISILRTDLLPGGLGWFLVGLSAFLLIANLLGSGVPVGIVYVLPTVIGVALFFKPDPASS